MCVCVLHDCRLDTKQMKNSQETGVKSQFSGSNGCVLITTTLKPSDWGNISAKNSEEPNMRCILVSVSALHVFVGGGGGLAVYIPVIDNDLWCISPFFFANIDQPLKLYFDVLAGASNIIAYIWPVIKIAR